MTSSIKPEVHKIITMPSEEDRATAIGNMHKNMVKIGRVVPNIGSRTDKHKDRQTDRHTYYNTPLLYRGRGVSNEIQEIV